MNLKTQSHQSRVSTQMASAWGWDLGRVMTRKEADGEQVMKGPHAKPRQQDSDL